MRLSRVTVPTLKEKPAEAEIPSHELLLRAGMMRSVAAGIYALLPLGTLALEKIEDIVREEMNAAGAMEVVLPGLHPSDPWIQSGRWQAYGPEMMRLVDRQGREFCFAPTAEEVITLMVSRTAPSYRDLPLNLYQIQTKFRDEIRPRFGLLRAREFRMKDAYSFHTSEEELDDTYRSMYEAYSAVARRCSLDVRVIDAATGLIGGDVSQEFMVISEVGEDEIIYCTECEYGASAEMEVHRPGVGFGSPESGKLEEVKTPGMVSVEDVAVYLDTDNAHVLKCVLYVVGGEALAVFVPGYREVSEAKLECVLGTGDFHPLREDERELYPAVTAGFTGPVGLEGVRILFDQEVKGSRGLVCGANRVDHHLKGVEEGRDFKADSVADIAYTVEGDLCARCGGVLRKARGIEIGHIFKLGLKYSEPLGASFTDQDGNGKPMVMGTYGIGTSRILATVVELHHDDAGIKWPKAVAPLPLELLVLSPESAEQAKVAADLEQGLKASGMEILVDDRDVSPGIKFNDADLIGLPAQVIIGNKLAEGKIDLKLRYSGERIETFPEGANQAIERAIDVAT
ncbi:MAG: proline--tRNA ligase [Actinobacteria bacterium]|nr:proline--tRNA ligase [Actinomycetota bacterium]